MPLSFKKSHAVTLFTKIAVVGMVQLLCATSSFAAFPQETLSKDELYEQCDQSWKTPERCACLIDEPLTLYVKRYMDRVAVDIERTSKSIEQEHAYILKDPTMSDQRIEQVCALSDQYDREVKATIPPTMSLANLTPDVKQQHMEKQAEARAALSSLHQSFLLPMPQHAKIGVYGPNAKDRTTQATNAYCQNKRNLSVLNETLRLQKEEVADGRYRVPSYYDLWALYGRKVCR